MATSGEIVSGSVDDLSECAKSFTWSSDGDKGGLNSTMTKSLRSNLSWKKYSDISFYDTPYGDSHSSTTLSYDFGCQSKSEGNDIKRFGSDVSTIEAIENCISEISRDSFDGSSSDSGESNFGSGRVIRISSPSTYQSSNEEESCGQNSDEGCNCENTLVVNGSNISKRIITKDSCIKSYDTLFNEFKSLQIESFVQIESQSKELRDLPIDLLQQCFARVPFRFHPRMRAVCKQWRAIADGHRLYQIRRDSSKTEPWTFILENEYDYYRKYLGLRGHTYNINFDIRGPPPPQTPYGCIMWDGDRPYVAPFENGHPIKRLLTPLRLEYAVAGINGLLYVMGGRPALNGWNHGFSKPSNWEVFSRMDVYDPSCNKWAASTPLPNPRYSFAACGWLDSSNNPFIIIAGGFGYDDAPLSSASLLNISNSKWKSLAPLKRLKGSCRGQIVDAKFFVKQIDGEDELECLDLNTLQWNSARDQGQVVIDPLSIGDMNNNRSRNFTCLHL